MQNKSNVHNGNNFLFVVIYCGYKIKKYYSCDFYNRDIYNFTVLEKERMKNECKKKGCSKNKKNCIEECDW